MKKLVVILCIFSLMLNLVSCKTEEVSTKKKVVIKEEDSIEETDETEAVEYEEEEQEPTTSENRYAYTSGNYKLAPWTIEKTVIYSDNDVLITAEELILDYNEEYVGLVINVGNDRTSDITIGIKAFYINNLLCDFYYDDFLTVGACSTEHQIIDVSIDTLKEFDINDVSQVSIAVKGYTPNNYELINTDLVDIPTSSFDNLTEPYPNDFVIFGDNDSIVAAARYEYYNDEKCVISIFITNKTDTDMFVECRNVTVDELNCGNCMKITVAPGKSDLISYDMYGIDAVYQANIDNGVDTVSMEIGYRLSNTVELDWISDTKTIIFD